MAKSIEKKRPISASKKIIKKSEKKEKCINPIAFKRLTRSNKSQILLESKEKVVQHKKKSEFGNAPRASKKPANSSKLDKNNNQTEESQQKIPKRVTRSLKIKELSSDSIIEQNSDLSRVTRSMHKTTSLSEASNTVTPPIVQTENRIEKRVNFIKLEKFEKDTICLAKQKYSCPWPAQILEIEKDKILVHFFGDKRVGYVQSTEIYDFVKSSEAIQSLLSGQRKPRGYVNGVVEIELFLGVDRSLSVLNKVQNL